VFLRAFIFLFLCVFQTVVFADDHSDGPFERNVNSNSRTFREVLLQNRNSDVGPQLRTDLKFTKWLTLAEPEESTSSSIIGLTKSGRLYQYVELDKNKFARRLSGTKCIKDFRVLKTGRQLVALGCDGQVYSYEAEMWSHSPLSSIVKQRFVHSVIGVTTITVLSFLYTFHLENDPRAASLIGTMVSFMGSGAYVFGQAAFGALLYDHSNQRPDGLIDTKLKTASLDDLDESTLTTILSTTDLKAHWQTNCDALLKTKVPEAAVRDVEEQAI
jgi:hypothetical protein